MEIKMARRVILSDDLTGLESVDVETITFMLQGTYYEIDLGEDSWKKMDSAFGRFIKVSREISSNAALAKFRETASSETDKLREWGKANGFEVGDRGRISDDLKAAYAKWVADQTDAANDSPTGKVTESNDQPSNAS